MSFNSEMTSLADAIRAKSGVSGKLTITEMTDAVDGIEINQGSDIDFTGVNVTADKMLSGVVAINASGNKVTGNIQSVTATKDGNKVTVPSGHVASQQIVTVGTAKSAATITPGTSDQTIAADTYLSGKQTIKGDANLTAENIKSGVRIFAVTGTFEGSGGGGSGGSGAFDLAKVTNYTPYAPAMTSVTSVVVSGIGDWIYSDDPESEDYEYNQYFSEANGTYNVTPETAGETDWKKRVYKHESKEYYLYYEYYDDNPDESTWFFSTSMDSDGQFIRKYNEYDWDTDEPLPVGDLESGESEWGDYDWEPFYVTLDVRTTAVPETPMMLKGVLATGYADGELSFSSAEQSFTGFEETPVVNCVYAVNDSKLIGSVIEYIDIFPGNSALFALDANTGSADLINGGTPSTYGSGTVLQNGEFCFDNTRWYSYAIGNAMKALKDFTIELDFTITSDRTGMCAMFGNKSSWGSDHISLQWARYGYRLSLHWGGYVDGLYGGADHSDWVNDGKYHHAAIVRKGSFVAVYTDGELTASNNYSTEAFNLAVENAIYLGYNKTDNVNFPGRVKHVRVLPFARYTNNFKPAKWVGYPRQETPDGLVFYAPLSSDASTAETGQNLNVYGSPVYGTVDGIPCVTLDGQSYLYGADNLIRGANPFTCSLWVKPQSTSAVQWFGSIGNTDSEGTCFLTGIRFSGRYSGGFYYHDNSESPVNADATKWTHLLFVYDGATLKTYANGAWQHDFSVGAMNLQNGWTIGCMAGSRYDEIMFGYVAALRIYNRALTADEIQALAQEFGK